MFIVADVGGTHTRIAGSDDLKGFSEPLIFETPQEYDAALAKIAEAMRAIAAGAPEAVAAGKPGFRNLPEWKGRPFAADLEQRVGVPVHAENDAALVGLGEAIYGAGKGNSIVAYVTVSTGVNGARIIGGRVDASRRGFEIGGQYLSLGESMQTLEDIVSGASVARRFDVASPKDLGAGHLVWEELARTLAVGVHNSILHWSPDIVVIGGSMMNEIGIAVPRVEAHVKDMMRKFDSAPPILHCALGDVGGLWGGLALLQEKRG